MMQPQRNGHGYDDSADFGAIVRAALICGCPNCRHAARERSHQYRADKTFKRAFKMLTGYRELGWPAGERPPGRKER